MISQVAGRLLNKELDRAEVMTSGGVAYELTIPLNTYESLPNAGQPCTLHTHLVVKEDGWQLYGFANVFERRVFQRVLEAKGVGPALAIGMLSALSAERLVRAIREKDLATLQGVPRVGRKKAEQLVLDLAEKMDDLLSTDRWTTITGVVFGDKAGSHEAVRALVALGYSNVDAERAIKAAIDENGTSAPAADLIRRALAHIAGGAR